MTGPIHTYGPTCLLADDDPDPSSWHSQDKPPKPRPQFFYVSSLPIDDPLTALPPPSGNQGPGNERAPPQPFSVKDNIALEESWVSLLRATKQEIAATKRSREGSSSNRNLGITVPGKEFLLDIDRKRQTGIHGDKSWTGSHKSHPSAPDSLLDDETYRNPETSVKMSGDKPRTRYTLGESDRSGILSYRKRESSPSDNPKTARRRIAESPQSEGAVSEGVESTSWRGVHSRDSTISGSPFARAPLSQSESILGRSIESTSSKDGDQGHRVEYQTNMSSHAAQKPSGLRTSVYQAQALEDSSNDTDSSTGTQEAQLKIPVGVSRLHLVELPNLKMKPIYWSPLHDISSILRATWFYKNTMLPVETELANKLEDGYVYLKPWTETWQDELNSCVENGAEAEMKIVHRLWVKDDTKRLSSASMARDQETSSPAPGGPERVATPIPSTASFDENRAAGGTAAHLEAVKQYISSSVIYVDGKDAQILRPSLLPSVSRGRRPLSAIRKGRQIGIPVVRGFNRRLWDQLHPSKPNPVDVRNYLRSNQSRTMSAPGRQICYACAIEEMRPTPTDLVFVIHGIGQKLSERMESFHFTHAINAFRRNINMELNSEPVWPHVRQGHGGIMILPVNWRSTLSLEDANFDSQGVEDPTSNQFTLRDITPETIPAVRSLISDVMLDIPYYMSHHKPKMIQAVVKEANRIFRLWCKNNPGFQQNGRVHLLAHSLGSAMALDILSHQPTQVPDFDFSKTGIHGDIFEFDTKDLFICGSPAGFFLLLNKANLLPRRGREKPGCEGDDLLRGVAGEADTYGCLAVDNLYNIMHTTDPVAYRVNAAVDSELANSLKVTSIPSASASFWKSFGSVFRWSSAPSIMAAATVTPSRPAAISKLPSNVELETHDFTREEIAEKRMFLLNDNGQIDYYLSGGGGPLNIQYLNMLSAHSSYWTLSDFVRFLVIEIARKQGKDYTIPAFRAEKKKNWKVHKGRLM
ncbi:DDHD domain-containing protein [Aspergillus coremiiformis]|uniref:DDHD domain-containing protein n=1 Tax=Aspergillus coremiiformis TaxID=138285 RepID=A0A5N6Z937_9EURO|nr:DDHD domain-containing protein [Aspergillus coremiiformis]